MRHYEKPWPIQISRYLLSLFLRRWVFALRLLSKAVCSVIRRCDAHASTSGSEGFFPFLDGCRTSDDEALAAFMWYSFDSHYTLGTG